MVGAVIIVIVLLVVLPVSIMMSGAVVAGILGWSAKEDAEARNEGSELVSLS